MATWTHTLQLSTGQTLTFTKTITDANALRIPAAYRTTLGMDPASTNQQIWTALAQGVFNGVVTNVKNQELAAEQAAVTPPADIT